MTDRNTNTPNQGTNEQAMETNDLQNQLNAIHRSQAVIEFELDGTIITANDNFCQALGYRLDEIKGRHHRMFVDPGYANTPEYGNFWKRMQNGEFFSGEYCRVTKSGDEIWIQASYNPILDEDGKPYKVVKFAADVTDAKMRSVESDSKLDALDRSQATIEFELDGTIIKANSNFCNALGYRMDEIKGRHHRMFVDPEYASSAEYNNFWMRLNSGEFVAGEFKRLHKDGSDIWIQASYNPVFDANGVPCKVVKFATDITKAKKAAMKAQTLSSMLDTAKSMYMTCDKDLVIQYANQGVIDMLRRYEDKIRSVLPTFSTANLVGSCIDQFHKKAAHQRNLLADPRNLPAESELNLAGLIFGVRAVPLYDAEGNHIGSGVEWSDYNEREKYRNEVQRVRTACDEGDLSVRGNVDVLNEDFGPMMDSINQIINSIVEPVNEAANVLERIADQDLTARVVGDYQGDHARIKDNVNQAATILQDALTRVNESAEQVSSASSQITEGAQKLAEGANTQASSIEEISASLEEMSSMTRQNADNATAAKSLANEAQSSAQNGKETMEKMQGAINAIKSSSDQTAKIVKTIDEIAFQTNLLALNAAVEAARAGDAGKGFAVVAEEVRSLAQRSAEAAKNTAELIETAVKNADNGVSITDQVQQILNEIFDGSSKVNGLITEIAAASKEQSDGISQVNDAVEAMNRVTQENAASSEESAAAAGELNVQVAELTSMLQAFDLGDGNTAPGSQTLKRPASASARPAASTALKRPASARPASSRPAARPAPKQVIPLDDDEMSDF